MKILELLNKHIKVFFIFCLFFSYNAISEDAVDIWEIDPKKITENSNKKKESEDNTENSIYEMQSEKTKDSQIIKEEPKLDKVMDRLNIYYYNYDKLIHYEKHETLK